MTEKHFLHHGTGTFNADASLEAMLTINGFNTAFDGDRMLLDCDM